MLPTFTLNNVPNSEPDNWPALEFEASWENDKPSASLKTNNFEFSAARAKIINNWIAAGMNGGPGIMEGIPYNMKGCTNSILFQGVLMGNHESAEFECDSVRLPLRETAKIDFVNDTAAGFSFAYLLSIGVITPADYIKIPYVVSVIPDYTQIMMLSISVFVMAKETIETVKEIAYLVTEAAGVFTTVPGIIKIAIYLVYLAALIVALIKLVQALIDNIIQPPKYKYGMKVKTLMQKACQFLGIGFSSNLLTNSQYKDAVIIPRKFTIPGLRNKDDALSPTAYGYFEGTFMDLILGCNEVWNAEVRVFGGIMHYERRRTFNLQSGFIFKKTSDDRWQKYKTNASELNSNYMVIWTLDNQELNTYDDYAGTSCQCVTTAIAINDPKNLLLRNLRERTIPFALCKRKESLTVVEQLLNDVINAIAGVANAITSVINAILNLVNSSFQIPQLPTNVLNNRIGWLKLSSDFTGVPKFGIFDSNNKLIPDNKTLTAAVTLMTGNSLLPAPFNVGFHYIELPKRGAQCKIYTNKEEAFCCDDFLLLLNNNLGKTSDGKDARCASILWKASQDYATVEYRVFEDYTLNLHETFVIDGN